MSLQSQLDSASAVFTKARKKYEGVVSACRRQIEESVEQMKVNEQRIDSATKVSAQAERAIDKIDEIIG